MQTLPEAAVPNPSEAALAEAPRTRQSLARG
jgi:hypothetical protein